MGSISAEPCAVLGRFAALLAEGGPLTPALHVLAHGLPVHNVAVRSVAGDLLGVGGEPLQVVQLAAPQDLVLPVTGADGVPLASLSVRGGRPSQLPALRAAAAVLGLALADKSAQLLVHDRERELDQLADALHDGPMQSLMVARYAADAAVRGGELEPARAAVQDAVVELRELVWSLRPRGGDGLVAALEQLVARRGARPLTLDLPSADVDVDPAVATLAYRVVQAAAPEQVAVRLQPEGICVEINSGLPFAQRWARRAEALGCRLTATADHCTLLLPRAAGSYSTDVRTTS